VTKFLPPYFLDLCEKLLSSIKGDDQACIRTIMSRCYYSAFLLCRSYLENKRNFKYPDNKLSHGAVWEAINRCSKKIGAKLNTLLAYRKVSDYHLDTPSSTYLQKSGTRYTVKCDFEEAKESIQLARIIEEELEKLS